ncbi:hypothetical protein N7510_002692 [Penicillium lagena]|uniref:uncharacterized protein n=1 Tax=Penicillium lagena TaxID=94218 RepID=UPI00253FD8DE|nr:uncharacterized protein N7510_002692 [Penicillium lagena]KAJ5626383.1 hypothetical protein N7510_002692 [Penicillium lagena]
MVRPSFEISSPTPGEQTVLGSSTYPPEYIWNSFSDSQRNSFISTLFPTSNVVNLQHKRPDSPIRQLSKDPWNTFEAIGEIFQDRSLLLARHKCERERLVHIQKLEHGSCSAPTQLDLMNQISHSSFLALQGCYLHAGTTFLIWEPVEVSVGQILASRCMITGSEIIEIVRSVLEGIQYLSDRGRVLATLSVDNVFLTYSGNVKIGTKHSKIRRLSQGRD